MKIAIAFLLAVAPLTLAQAADQTMTELSCADFRPTQEAIDRYKDLRGACEGIVETNGELFAKFLAIVRRVSNSGDRVQLYLPATEHTFTVNPDPTSRIAIGDITVRPRELQTGQEIRVYLAVNDIARPDIDEISFVSEDDLLVGHMAESGAGVIKPARVTTAIVTTEAIVEAFNAETRELKLIDVDGNRMTIIADERVGSLVDLQARDRIVIDYLESVAIVIAPAGSDSTNGSAEVLAASADEDNPALVSADTTIVTATVEAFSLEEKWATLRMDDGSSRTIQVREDAPLDLVKVGDQVLFQITHATAISVKKS